MPSRQITPEQAQEVVLVGNIGRFSLGFRQIVNPLFLQTRRMTDDDRVAAVAAGGRPGSVLGGAKLARQDGKYEGNDLEWDRL
jgi:hypothetical protein